MRCFSYLTSIIVAKVNKPKTTGLTHSRVGSNGDLKVSPKGHSSKGELSGGVSKSEIG